MKIFSLPIKYYILHKLDKSYVLGMGEATYNVSHIAQTPTNFIEICGSLCNIAL